MPQIYEPVELCGLQRTRVVAEKTLTLIIEQILTFVIEEQEDQLIELAHRIRFQEHRLLKLRSILSVDARG